jgi:dTDP-glucose pyrophosphorylase
MVKKAVILAGGLGTRMQKEEKIFLDKKTKEIADKGLKGLIPVGKSRRPFLDYSISRLIKTGYQEICLVINPKNEDYLNYYRYLKEKIKNRGIYLAFQEKPLGTANAVLSAKKFTKKDSFVVLNSDNLYSENVLKKLRNFKKEISYCPAYDRNGLLKNKSLSLQKVRRWAVLIIDKRGYLKKIIERPKRQEDYKTNGKILISMNIFRFTPEIFIACKKIKPHPERKEYELTSAIQYLIDKLNQKVKTFYVNEMVLDLTSKRDIPFVRKILKKEKIIF